MMYGLEVFLPEKVEEGDNLRKEILDGQADRYDTRLKQKMKDRLRFDIQLVLHYTTLGTAPAHANRYFKVKQESSAGDFDMLFEQYTTELKRLLIIGEPGAGKTVLLLKFAQRLVDLALHQPDYPIPVIVNLASWRNQNYSFREWLEQSLVYSLGRYRVDDAVAKQYAHSNNLLLLLDGLDEIPENHRDCCLKALTPYLKEVNAARKSGVNHPEVIICSRQQEYANMATNAYVQATVQIQPLGPREVFESLESIQKDQGPGSSADQLLKVLVDQPELFATLTTAFTVQLALNLAEDDSFDPSFLMSTHILLQRYISEEINKIPPLYTTEASYSWLGWLANQLLLTQKRVNFELADMQPNWLKPIWPFNAIRLLLTFLSFLIGLNEFDIRTIAAGCIVCVYIYQIGFFDTIYFVKAIKMSVGSLDFTFLWRYALFALAVAVPSGAFLAQRTDMEFALKVVATILPLTVLPIWLIYSFANVQPLIYSNKPYSNIKPGRYFWGSILIFVAAFYLLETLFPDGLLIIWGIYRPEKKVGVAIALIVLTSFTAIVPHFILRALLALKGQIPWRLVTFLDLVANRTGLLEKDGAQWRFKHLLIQQMLADRYVEQSTNKV